MVLGAKDEHKPEKSDHSEENVELPSDEYSSVLPPAQDPVPLQQARLQDVHHRPAPWDK